MTCHTLTRNLDTMVGDAPVTANQSTVSCPLLNSVAVLDPWLAGLSAAPQDRPLHFMIPCVAFVPCQLPAVSFVTLEYKR